MITHYIIMDSKFLIECGLNKRAMIVKKAMDKFGQMDYVYIAHSHPNGYIDQITYDEKDSKILESEGYQVSEAIRFIQHVKSDDYHLSSAMEEMSYIIGNFWESWKVKP